MLQLIKTNVLQCQHGSLLRLLVMWCKTINYLRTWLWLEVWSLRVKQCCVLQRWAAEAAQPSANIRAKFCDHNNLQNILSVPFNQPNWLPLINNKYFFFCLFLAVWLFAHTYALNNRVLSAWVVQFSSLPKPRPDLFCGQQKSWPCSIVKQSRKNRTFSSSPIVFISSFLHPRWPPTHFFFAQIANCSFERSQRKVPGLGSDLALGIHL